MMLKKLNESYFQKNTRNVMPIMVRVPGKATKIAYKILGMPQNIKNDKIFFG